MKVFATIVRYAWAAPATTCGFLLSVIAVCLGATCRVADGAFEVAGGRFPRLVPLLPRVFRIEAITFGHVIIGRDHSVLALLRAHEHVHVRQYECWGPLFIPLYLCSSLLQLLKGNDPYLDNLFEREAFAKDRMMANMSQEGSNGKG